jgi:acetylornithine/succinyldiaminopimelate/putrescine aminotransferase
MSSNRDLFYQYLGQTSNSPLAIEISHATGIYLYSPDGKRFVDLISGISISSVGHSHPEVVQAVIEQAEKHMHTMVYGEMIQSAQVRYAKAICDLLPSSLKSVYFVNSGSEAVEGAMKLAKRYTGKTEIVSFCNAYHGSSHGALSLMGKECFKQAFRPLLPDIRILPYNSIESVAGISGQTACVVVEPVQGEAGVVPANKEFLTALRKKCDETGALLVFDEIQTGMGRTGTMFAFEQYQVVPDILLLAKAFGGGMPLGAFISSQKIMSVLKENPPLGHITSFGGHPVSCAAGLAALNVNLKDQLFLQAKKKGDLFVDLLAHPAIREIRKSGLLIAIDLGDEELVKKVISEALKKGIMTDWFLFNPESIRIAPPLTISEEEIHYSVKLLIECLDVV